MSTFALVADEFPAKVPLELADALHVVLKLPVLDAKTTAARTRGIWAENVPAASANIIQKMLATYGHQASVLEQERIVAPILAVRVQRVLLEAEGATFFWNYREEFEKFPWERIVGVSAGLVYVEKIVRKSEIVDSGMYQGRTLGSRVETKTIDESIVEPTCLLALANAAQEQVQGLRFVRLRGRGIQYAETFPEAKPALSREFFRLFLARLGTLASNAQITSQTLTVVAGKSKAHEQFVDPNFRSDEEHEAHFRWYLTRNQ